MKFFLPVSALSLLVAYGLGMLGAPTGFSLLFIGCSVLFVLIAIYATRITETRFKSQKRHLYLVK